MESLSALEYFRSRTNSALDLIREIVEIESPSNDVDRSKAVVLWIENEMRNTGLDLEMERIPAEGIGEHLLIKAFPGIAKPVLLLGHTDTVHPVGTKELNPTRIDGDRLYGCGVFDMKANIVLLIEAFRFFTENAVVPRRPITVLLSCDEEVGSHSGRALVEAEAANAYCCYVLEPSAGGKVKTGRKGTGMYHLRSHGIPAHAGLEPEKGASAILELSRQIERLHALNDFPAGTTVNVCTMSGGTTTNVIPEHAECTVDVRFSTMAEAESIDASIRGISSVDDRVTIDITGGINRPPMERTDAVAALFQNARNTAAALGYELGETQVGGASDGNFVGAIGVPVLDGLGIAGDGAHTLNEYVCIDDFPKRAALIAALLAKNDMKAE